MCLLNHIIIITTLKIKYTCHAYDEDCIIPDREKCIDFRACFLMRINENTFDVNSIAVRTNNYKGKGTAMKDVFSSWMQYAAKSLKIFLS